MMTITIAVISMGIAVDNTIHYIFRHRAEYLKDNSYKSYDNTHTILVMLYIIQH